MGLEMRKLCFIGALCTFLLVLSQGVHSESERSIRKVGTGQPSGLTIEGNYWALIIGINEYVNLPPDKQLEGARHDAEAVARILREKYGFAKERVKELYDTKATRRQIIIQFLTLAKTLTDKDNLLIYYAGHGVYDKDLKLGDWIPSDAELDDPSSFVSNSDVQRFLKAIKAKHILTIADSCFSESLMGKTRNIGALSDAGIKELYQDKSRWILTSGGLYPVPDKGKEGHSIFAFYLLRILERNKNPYLPVQHLIPELQRFVSNESSQMPKGAPIVGIGDEGGQFIFRLAYAKLAPTEDLTRENADKIQEDRKKMLEEEKARLEEDRRRYRVQMEQMLKEVKEKALELERKKHEMELQKNREAEKLRVEKARQAEERRQLEREKKKKKKKKSIFIPPTF